MGLKRIKLPELGEGVTEGEIIKIKVSEGEKISMDQPLLEVMTDKASMEVPSYIEGIVQNIEIAEGDIVSVGADLFTVKIEGEDSLDDLKKQDSKGKETQKESSSLKQAEKSEASLKESPLVSSSKQTQKGSLKTPSLAIPATRKLAEELGLSLEEIEGTGPQGEIKRGDLISYVKSRLSGSSIAPIKSAPLPQNFEEVRREPIRGIKRLMFNSMTLSKATIPHFTIGERVQVGHLVNLRSEMKSNLEKQGLKAGYLPFFIKALIPALKEFPIFNSLYSPETKEIVFRKDYNIGFAVDSPKGLLVPVLKRAQNKNFLEIVRETGLLAEQVRQDQIERENLMGAGITITNLGSLGGFYGTPIINPPEMAIIGIYNIFQQVVKNSRGEFEEKPFINLSVTCDHRFIDGATAARFLKSFMAKIEEPSLLLLE